MPRSKRTTKTVETLTHDDASRKNIPTAEYQAVMADDDRNPIRVAYERRNRDLDPQLVWRGKDEQNGSVFVQIGDENVHRVRAVMDEVFGDENFVTLIAYAKTTGFSGIYLSSICDSVGNAAQRHLAAFRQTHVGPHRREGHQPLGGRGDEGVSGVRVAITC